MKRKLLLPLIIMVLILASGCSEESVNKLMRAKEAASDIYGIKTEIEKLLPQGEFAGFELKKGKVLKIQLYNTLVAEASTEQRAYLSEEICLLIRKFIKQKNMITNLETIVVEFSSYEKKFFLIDFTVQVDLFKHQVKECNSNQSIFRS